MIIEMRKRAPRRDITAVQRRIRKLGFEVQVNQGQEHVVIGVFGSGTSEIDIGIFEAMEGVEKVVRIQKQYKRSARDFHPQDTVVQVGEVAIGGREVVMMAGPCAVESWPQLLACAKAAKAAGAKILRGGAWKPRTSPDAWQGLKEKGLNMLVRAREETGLKIVTEVVDVRDLELIAQHADIIQIGARNMQNYPLLEAVGMVHKPVLLKRGLVASVEEWLMAADYVLKGNGEPQVILCHRGIRTSDNSTRFTFDPGVIPVLKQLTHLPVVTDPSHAAGNYRFVPAYARMGLTAGADGFIIETHPHPKEAKCDGAQAMTFSDFSRLMDELRPMAKLMGRSI